MLLGLLAGCDAQTALDGAGDQKRTTSVAAEARLPIGDARSVLATLHGGVRRVEVWDWTGETPRHLAFREVITTDGEDDYSIEPLEPITDVAPSWDGFQLTQRLREGFIFRYRDLALRDEGLFRRNYRLTDLGLEREIAGRTAARYHIQDLRDDARSYDLAVDLETGILLGYKEYDAQGRSLSAMEYETFEVKPDLAPVVWHRRSNYEESLDWRGDFEQQLGEEAFAPRLLPEGYELRAAARVEDGKGASWLKLTYLDGIEPLFFLYALDDGRKDRDGERIGKAELLPDAPADEVTLFRLGSTSVAQGRVRDHTMIAMGKVADDALLGMIESALP